MSVPEPVDPAAIRTLFDDARTLRQWQRKPVEATLLRRLYATAVLGPTSGNGCPGRFVFLLSDEAKQRLEPHLDRENVERTMTAPVTVIVAHDQRFHEAIARLNPANERFYDLFQGDPKFRSEQAFRNGSLQGAYLIMAARALGLDAGPMSGFSRDGADATFLSASHWRSNFLCNLGYVDPET